MFQKYLIEHCSPTLASLKTANLFSIANSNTEELEDTIRRWNCAFRNKGVQLIILKSNTKISLIYVCRIARLQRDLLNPGVFEFLKEYGYESNDAYYCIERLKQRLSLSENFPHEIGIFLSYPVDDVKGFIKNAGSNYKCVGCWKVYCNECDAIKTFSKFKKCNEVYNRLWLSGERNIYQLTVRE